MSDPVIPDENGHVVWEYPDLPVPEQEYVGPDNDTVPLVDTTGDDDGE